MGIGSDLDRPLNAGGGVAIDVFQGPVADASPRLRFHSVRNCAGIFSVVEK